MKNNLSLLVIIALILPGCSNNNLICFDEKNNQTEPEAIVQVENTIRSLCNHERVVRLDKVEPTYLKPGHIEFYFCLDCHKSFYDVDCQNEIPNSNLSITDKNDGRYIAPLTKRLDILGSNIKRYLSATTEQEMIAALKDCDAYNDQLENKIVWPGNNAPYTIEVGSTRDFVAPDKTYVTNKTYFSFERTLTPGQKLYYRIKDGSNNIIYDDLSCEVDNSFSLRNIYVEGVSNVRDLGGWKTVSGQRVKYGKLFRGAQLNTISGKGKETFLGTLGIKNEIDVRTDGSQKLVDPRLTYNKFGMWQYTTIIPDYEVGVPQLRKNSEGKPVDINGNVTEDPTEFVTDWVSIGFSDYSPAAIKSIFEFLADDSHYPIYYHCSAGADRTGTISYLISGLLGVPYEDLTKDFELTSFSVQGARWRDNANEGETAFAGYGIHYVLKGTWPNLNYDIHQWGKMHQVILARYGASDGLLSTAIENYLKEVCNVSDATITAVRNILLED